MKIAIPYADGLVFQHFNEASLFKIYTVDDFDILSSGLVTISQGTPAQTAESLREQGVNVVICGNMGGAYGEADAQVESFLNGQLHFETKESRREQKDGESNGNVSACGSTQCF